MSKQPLCFRNDHIALLLGRHTVDYNRVWSCFVASCDGDALYSRCRTSAPLHEG